MNILYVQPGSGGSFYCQNCLRDTALADALRARGHRVTLLPLYLPATAFASAPEDVPVFYGAVSLYLRHRYAWLRRLPRDWFQPLDRWPVLRFAARFAGSTSARGLEALTLSMLKGLDGLQAEELRLVTDWLSTLPAETKPSVIVLSNALLTGMAAALKQAAQCPVICWLQDEHVWIDAMSPDLRAAVQETLVAGAQVVDRFVAVSASYAVQMAALLRLDVASIGVVYPGVDPAAYPKADVTKRPFTVGFLGRLSPAEGFDRFVDAFVLLRRDARFAGTRLAATGGPAPERGFLKRQIKKLAAAGLMQDVEISTSRFARDRFGFLSELSLLAVAGSEHVAFGHPVIEAMAAGVPVALPAQGAFLEIATAAGCGVITADAQPETMARAWADALSAPERLRDESALGRLAARQVFSQEASASALERVLEAARNG
jgi:glycosyltransferase involved in cell wall biosynthesis